MFFVIAKHLTMRVTNDFYLIVIQKPVFQRCQNIQNHKNNTIFVKTKFFSDLVIQLLVPFVIKKIV